MFEILVAVIFTIIIVNVSLLWVKICLLVVLVLLVLPGVDAMYSCAPFVPTKIAAIKTMLKFGKFDENDRVVDVGCGDGRVIREIAKCRVKSAIGYEFSIPTYLYARFRSFLSGGRERIKFANFWNRDFSGVDAVICFLLEDSMRNFEKKIWVKLRPGTRVISNIFKMKGVPVTREENGVYLYVKK